MARDLELDKRAKATKEREARRKHAEKMRVLREEKERKAREQLGIGKATQMIGFSHTQKSMKVGMEGWLGKRKESGGKRKRDDDDEGEDGLRKGTDDIFVAEEVGRKEEKEENDSFGSNMSLDDALLGQLEKSTSQQDETTNATTINDADTASRSPAYELVQSPTDMSEENDQQESLSQREAPPQDLNHSFISPPTKRIKTTESPTNDWAQFVDGNTQILHELSQVSPPGQVKADPRIAFPPMSTQDLELHSDDLFECGLPLPKTENPQPQASDKVMIRDFAYFKTSNEALTAPNAPALSRTSRSMLRSFGRRAPNVGSPSQKTTATCSTFTADQCSFTTDYHNYGLSTQLLQQAIDDGENDTESEDEEVYSQALETVKIPDHVLMPPPPLKLSPRVFKPPARQDGGLFAQKGGLQIFGLSTQLLNEAINDDGDVTDEDEDDALFSVPLHRPAKVESVGSRAVPPPLRRTTSQYGKFGLSTQMVQDAVFEDVELTDDEGDTQAS